MKRIWLFILPALVLIFLAACTSPYPKEEVDKFAQCLTANNVTMYGAYWCPHCAKVKQAFGQSFQYVNYVECDPKCDITEGQAIPAFCHGHEGHSEVCISKGIDKYATFEFPDGTRLTGEPSFQDLSDKSGCPAPQKG